MYIYMYNYYTCIYSGKVHVLASFNSVSYAMLPISICFILDNLASSNTTSAFLDLLSFLHSHCKPTVGDTRLPTQWTLS